MSSSSSRSGEEVEEVEDKASASAEAEAGEEKPDRSVDELASAIEKIHVADEQAPSKELKIVADWILESRKIVVVSGAGVSVAAGIPDFRTKGTGLYDNLQKYNLPYPEAVFDLQFYARNPEPFVALSKEIWPGIVHAPTLTHSFLAMLAHHNRLLRLYSQNIDGLEYLANIPEERLVECHGHFRSASCILCGTKADAQAVQQTIVVEGQVPTCRYCQSYVKPDIVFFGESLPDRFHQLLRKDLKEVDLLLVLGTSLQVAPVSLIPDMVSSSCKRVLVNREFVGDFDLDGKRDVFLSGDCDDTIQELAALLQWYDDLKEWNQKAKESIGGGSSGTSSDSNKDDDGDGDAATNDDA